MNKLLIWSQSEAQLFFYHRLSNCTRKINRAITKVADDEKVTLISSLFFPSSSNRSSFCEYLFPPLPSSPTPSLSRFLWQLDSLNHERWLQSNQLKGNEKIELQRKGMFSPVNQKFTDSTRLRLAATVVDSIFDLVRSRSRLFEYSCHSISPKALFNFRYELRRNQPIMQRCNNQHFIYL